MIGGKELRQKPSRAMDGRHQSDQCGGVCHRSDKERQDCAEGCKANCNTKKTAIEQVDSDVVTQMLAGKLFDFCEGEHGCDFTLNSEPSRFWEYMILSTCEINPEIAIILNFCILLLAKQGVLHH